MATTPGDTFYYPLFLIFSLTALLLHFLIAKLLNSRTQTDAPPSPLSLPIIGHLHLMGSVLPKSLQTLANRHGPLMQLRLGASTCVVVSNASMAKEVLKTHELNFSSRPSLPTKGFIYGSSKFILAPYGDYWRFMKKLCMTKLLAVPQLDKFMDIRDQEKFNLVERIMKFAGEGKLCDLSSESVTLTNNVICRMAMSTRCSDSVDEAKEIKGLVETCLNLAGKLAAGDILGPLKVLEYFSGNRKKLVEALGKYDRIVEELWKEHEEKAKMGLGSDDRKDIMDILLEIYNDPTAEIRLSRNDIKAFLLDIFFAGTDTTSNLMQWAMGELINKPEILQKLRDEINDIVGQHRLINESDIQNLPYLRAVIKEALRLHPSAPIVLRASQEDCKINNSFIKAKTRVLINVYAVMRDPESWINPDEFMPERFLESSKEKIGEHQMEYKGQNFRYLPFGSGRRGCAGASLAMLVAHVGVGVLVQCFDWKLENGKEVDLTPGSGFAAEMAKPLVCFPIKLMDLP